MMWRNSPTSYGTISRVLHWMIALLFLVQIPLGFLTQATGDRPAVQFALYQWHKSMGFLILALAALRLLWSLASRKPGETGTPSRFGPWAARAVHAVLLLLTLAIPLTGWAIASASPLRIPSYVFDVMVVPDLPLSVSDEAEALWSQAHAWLAYGACALLALHASAALFHALRPDSGSLHGMLPQRRRR